MAARTRAIPDFAPLHPGYNLTIDRRQASIKIPMTGLSAMQARGLAAIPDFASLHPGYDLTIDRQQRRRLPSGTPMTELSAMQRRFAAAVATGQTAEQAAETAGYPRQQRGWRIANNMANGKVLALIAYLRAGLAEVDPDDGVADGSVSREDVIRMLNADRRLAYREGTPSAAVAASMAIAKIGNLIVDRRQVEVKPLPEMSDADLARHLAALEREARAVLAIDVTAETVDDEEEKP